MADEVNWRAKIEDMSLAEMKERISVLDNKEDSSGLTDDEDEEKEALENEVAEQEEDDEDEDEDEDGEIGPIDTDKEVADKDV